LKRLVKYFSWCSIILIRLLVWILIPGKK
jgi:hypothetical protein